MLEKMCVAFCTGLYIVCQFSRREKFCVEGTQWVARWTWEFLNLRAISEVYSCCGRRGICKNDYIVCNRQKGERLSIEKK